MNSTPRGFTLLELVVVLVIVALASAVAVPAFTAVRPARPLDAAGARVMDAMRNAHARAVSSGREVVLVVDVPHARAWRRPRGTSFALDLPDGCRLDGAPRTALRFSPDGTARGTAPVIACGSARATAVVDPLTGQARLVEAP